MSSCKVGNQTNSQDPQAVNSRVFVGNLNTFQCSKTDVERRFQRYGRIAGISMHKGYAFIQFTNPFDARSACLGENGRLLWGQTLDVNMVAEPKAHQTGRKRQNIAKTGNDWDYYYDSYYAQMGLQTPRLIPPMKRPRIHVPANPYAAVPVPSPTTMSNMVNSAIFHNTNTSIQQIQQQQLQQQQQLLNHQQQRRSNHNNNNKSSSSSIHNHHKSTASSPINNVSISELKTYSTPDILICGNCRELFSEIEQLMQHKQNYCKLRFTCKCHMLNGCQPRVPGEEPASLLCSQCKDSFQSAWDLMVHVQTAHLINIYQLGMESNGGDQDNEQQEQNENVESPNSLLTLALLGGSASSSSNGDPQSSSTLLTNEAEDGNHKCDNSCQTTSSFLVETNNNINHDRPAAGDELLSNGVIIQQPMSSGSSTSSISTSTYTDGGDGPMLGAVANGHGVIGTEDEDEVEGVGVTGVNGLQPQQHSGVRLNGVLNNNTGIFLKETTTQTLGCQTDQQMMTSNGLDDQQDCSTTMLTAIKVEDGAHVVKYVTGRV